MKTTTTAVVLGTAAAALTGTASAQPVAGQPINLDFTQLTFDYDFDASVLTGVLTAGLAEGSEPTFGEVTQADQQALFANTPGLDAFMVQVEMIIGVEQTLQDGLGGTLGKFREVGEGSFFRLTDENGSVLELNFTGRWIQLDGDSDTSFFVAGTGDSSNAASFTPGTAPTITGNAGGEINLSTLFPGDGFLTADIESLSAEFSIDGDDFFFDEDRSGTVGLGIDATLNNFVFVPTPGAAALAGLGILAACRRRR